MGGGGADELKELQGKEQGLYLAILQATRAGDKRPPKARAGDRKAKGWTEKEIEALKLGAVGRLMALRQRVHTRLCLLLASHGKHDAVRGYVVQILKTLRMERGGKRSTSERVGFWSSVFTPNPPIASPNPQNVAALRGGLQQLQAAVQGKSLCHLSPATPG